MQNFSELQSSSMKTIDDFFADWESHVFGYGYGTGEEHVLLALKIFMDALPIDGNYDCTRLEGVCTPAVAWLLINTLCHADVIEYGTSPRFGWLTANGKALAHYVRVQTFQQLLAAVGRNEEYVHCYPDHCNCALEGDEVCCWRLNPFWPKRTQG